MKYKYRKLRCLVCFVFLVSLLILLSACATSGSTSQSDPLSEAEQEFEYCVSGFHNAESALYDMLSEAEALMESINETDVADPATLVNLQTTLAAAKNHETIPVPEMASTLEEINLQCQEIANQTDIMKELFDNLEVAVSQVTASQEEKQAEYDNISLFEAAEQMGYKISEVTIAIDNYYVCFTYDGCSFVISDKSSINKYIIFYGLEVGEHELIGAFNFLDIEFSDGSGPARDSQGHWTFSSEQKRQLLELLENFKDRGVVSFVDGFTEVSADFLTAEMASVVDEYNLTVAYQKISGGYRFVFTDGTKLAWFAAIYSEADFRPSDSAPGLNTFDGNEYYSAAFSFSDFPIDYVNADGYLISEPERAEQLQEFFAYS